ncbi:hypothetical protein M9H77_07941 [Catharanthus roseus]|uniref:Uncharacterized protein n=1 Tax=Catharanthus roseus TaxID=4058 RepID=A0ACC0BWP0_CATRO|nr:hypothetical protein M9H77_07941 [Catharanthus roseus]
MMRRPYVLIVDTTYKINKPNFLHYLFNTWLNPLAHKFIKVWKSKVFHFGVETTNRVKSKHSVLKLWFSTSHGNLDTVFHNIDSSSLDYSRLKKKYNAKSNPILKNISNNIIHLALKEIWVELKRDLEIIDNPKDKCGHYLRTSHGLPCSYELITRIHDCLAFILADGSDWRYDSYRLPGRTPTFYYGMPSINSTSCKVIVISRQGMWKVLIIALHWDAGTCKASNGRVLSPSPTQPPQVN